MAKLIFTERDEKLALHYFMLTRQVTGLTDSFLHIFRLHSRGDETGNLFKGYKAYAQTELGDAIHHIKEICETLGLDFKETEIMGDARYKEKQEEFLMRHPNDHWI
jgi:hypothetical protein